MTVWIICSSPTCDSLDSMRICFINMIWIIRFQEHIFIINFVGVRLNCLTWVDCWIIIYKLAAFVDVQQFNLLLMTLISYFRSLRHSNRITWGLNIIHLGFYAHLPYQHNLYYLLSRTHYLYQCRLNCLIWVSSWISIINWSHLKMLSNSMYNNRRESQFTPLRKAISSYVYHNDRMRSYAQNVWRIIFNALCDTVWFKYAAMLANV
jgi:hypothetical protein